jgi:hypothetical protein
MKRNIKYAFLVLATMMGLVLNSAMAQTGFGIRAGVTADPTQFHFGGHFATDPFLGDLTFRPNLEIGVGDHVTNYAFNFELVYPIQIPKRDFSIYIGVGPALVISDFDEDRGTNTGGGLNMLLGLEHKKRIFGELKIGAFDSPGFKFTLGYTFR